MTTLQGQIEKMARDITTGPDLSDTIEIAVVGGMVGAALGYLKDKGDGAKSFAMWGAGLGIAGQYMLFHMLRPAARRGYAHRVGQGMHDICPDGSGWDQTLGKCVEKFCSPGTYYDDFYGKCMPKVGKLPGSFPETIEDWRRTHKTGVEPLGPTVQCSPGLHWDPVRGYCVPVIATQGYYAGRGGGRGGAAGHAMMPHGGGGHAHGHGFHHGHHGHGWGGGGWGGGGWGSWGGDYPVPVPVPVDGGEPECCDEEGYALLDEAGNPVCPNPPCPQREEETAAAGYYTGAVLGIGGARSGMPFGPGPWPTQYAAAPDVNRMGNGG